MCFENKRDWIILPLLLLQGAWEVARKNTAEASIVATAITLMIAETGRPLLVFAMCGLMMGSLLFAALFAEFSCWLLDRPQKKGC